MLSRTTAHLGGGGEGGGGRGLHSRGNTIGAFLVKERTAAGSVLRVHAYADQLGLALHADMNAHLGGGGEGGGGGAASVVKVVGAEAGLRMAGLPVRTATTCT